MYEMLVGMPPFYNDKMNILLENIKKGKLDWPKFLSENAKNFLQKLLHKDPNKRPSMQEAMNDPFFADIDWEALENK